MDKFIQHGSYRIDIVDGILLVDATGPFNEELVELFDLDLRYYVEKLNGSQWVELAVLRMESAYTPDALHTLSQSIKWRVNQGMCAIAILFVDATARSLAEHQLTHTFKKYPELHFEFFTSQPKAMMWCKKHHIAIVNQRM